MNSLTYYFSSNSLQMWTLLSLFLPASWFGHLPDFLPCLSNNLLATMTNNNSQWVSMFLCMVRMYNL